MKGLHIRQSMDGKSRWADNIMIERWVRSLKTELIYMNEFRSPRELRQSIRSYIDDYNRLRPHEALDYAAPDAIYYASFCVARPLALTGRARSVALLSGEGATESESTAAHLAPGSITDRSRPVKATC